ncbi:MAG: hypothetical protein ACOYN4_17410, partial [Bacteroidales bacterium]
DIEVNNVFDIVASDTVDIYRIGSKIHVNITGNYNLLLEASILPKVFFLIAGVPYPYRVQRLYLTDTDNPTGLLGIANIIDTDYSENEYLNKQP